MPVGKNVTETASLDEIKLVIKEQFDESFYTNTYLGHLHEGEALEHFVNIGVHKHYDPCVWFSVADYLQRYPDVESSASPRFRLPSD